jgi:hypothetical protein
MSQAISALNRFSFTRKFEEVPLVHTTVAGERFYAAMLSGEFEVEFDMDGNWQFGGLWLDLDNLGWGANAKGQIIPLDPDKDEELIFLLYNALMRNYETYIDAWVSEELDERAAA